MTQTNPAPAAPCQCWACNRTAQIGTPSEATAVEPHLCPRCDHAYDVALAGGDATFRGVDSPVFVQAAAEPAEPVACIACEEKAAEPVACIACEEKAADRDGLCPACRACLDAAAAQWMADTTAARVVDDEAITYDPADDADEDPARYLVGDDEGELIARGIRV